MIGNNRLDNEENLFLNDDKTMHDFSVEGTCSRCLQCCTDFIPITQEEVYLIKKYISKHNIPRNIARSDSGDLYLLCPFISEEGCSIYPVRPQVCRGFCCWKSTVSNLQSKEKCLAKAFYNRKESNFVSLHDIFYGKDETDRTYTKFLLSCITKNKRKD